MTQHLANLEQIFAYVLKESSAQGIVDVLHGDIRFMVERHILVRDLENFITYFNFVPHTQHAPKLKLDQKLVQAFVDRTYGGGLKQTHEQRARKLHEYLRVTLGDHAEVNRECITTLERRLKEERAPSLAKLMRKARIALILKWFRGPLQDQLSDDLEDYISFLAAAYGQLQASRIFDIAWQTHKVGTNDWAVITSELMVFVSAIAQALSIVRGAKDKQQQYASYHQQFQLVLNSLDNLMKRDQKAEVDSIDAFTDKVIVSVSLIYLQDDFVEKDPELEKFIQLLISLYYQFRDKRFAVVV